ncbi:MAG: thiamine diphosphokinase [Lachnospiraceae bacterium]|nr:thiamine diphosphokinase [Lachnospiraceae bacterium]
MRICYIIGAGEFGDGIFYPSEEDLVIACDGGYDSCRERGIRTDLVVGDFDSLSYVPDHPRVVRLKPQKDDTDTGWAVSEGLRQGYREFVIYGGTGGRISHTIANIQILTDLALKGAHGILIGKDSWYRVICNEEICFKAEEKGFISVFCIGEQAEGVFEDGLKYGLHDAVLKKEYPVGVSNEFIGKESRIAVKNGVLLLIWEAGESIE